MDSQRFEASVRQAENVAVVDVRGEIDVATASQFKEIVGTAAEQGSHVIINMADVTYMDSSGFGTLLSATKRLRPDGGSVHLVGCNDVIERMLRITRLSTIFNIHSSEDDALRALTTNGASTP